MKAAQLEPAPLSPLPSPAFSLAARLRSFTFAGRGLKTLLATQHNAWIHATATAAAVTAGLAANINRYDWLAVIVAIVSVWTAESLNTAFEFLCDVASPQFHPLVARAKDIAAAAVLICALGALVTAAIIFGPHVQRMLL